MNEKQREWLAAKLADAANLGVAVMLFGWVMAPQKPPFWVPLAAGVLWAIFYLDRLPAASEVIHGNRYDAGHHASYGPFFSWTYSL
jgi:hypothetical protein